MPAYTAPLEDYHFLLYDLWEFEGQVRGLPGCEELSRDLVEAVLKEGAKFCTQELLPLNRSGDEEGCHYENGVVRTPEGFKAAYDAFVAGGWTGLGCDPAYGGQGLPKTLLFAMDEFVCSTNLSFGTYPGLSFGAYHALELHGAEGLKDFFLPKLTDGSWSGTMCLTEPHCGTDLGLIRTRAEPGGSDEAGLGACYNITGTKVFVSAGEHDLTENVLHLVLARLPDAPPGVKGISLFLVPKFLPKADRSLGPRNGVSCGGIEAKMGIKASATCVMNFEEATGYLVGAPHSGLRAMFAMMNFARLAVGLQGLGLAETAYQSARDYARERRAGRALSGPKEPDQPADPIIVHPDVRKTLLTMRALNEGARGLSVWVALALDRAERHPDPEEREAAEDLVALLTPVIKAFLTDSGFQVTNLGVQVYGGHGYIRENGMEQLVRDARITQIYEGANGIQALDLVGRKLPYRMGRYLRRFFHPLLAFLEAKQGEAEMQPYVLPLAKAFGRLQQATLWVAQQGLRDPEEAGAAAGDYLRLFALTALGYVWARSAEAILAMDPADRRPFLEAKLATAQFYMARILPETSGLFAALSSGAGPVMALDEALF